MAGLSVLMGFLLILLGVVGYVASNMVSPTALIPAAFGIVILMLGAYGREPSRRRVAMHLAMGIALVGILGSIRGVLALARWMTGSYSGAMTLAPIARALMAILLAIYLAAGIKSFVAARRR